MQELKLINKASKKVEIYKGPEKWEELSTEQFLAAINAKLKIAGEFEQAITLVKIFFNMPVRMMQALTTVQAMQLAGAVNFLFEAKIYLRKWHLPFIYRIGKKPLAGPSDMLGNLSFAEMMLADMAISDYQKTKNDNHLNKLIAILYREKDEACYLETGDYRPKFNKNLLGQQINSLGFISEQKKQAVLINYIGCRELMSKSFRFVFPEKEITEQDSTVNKSTWLDVAIQLARKEKALGSITDVEESNVWLVFKILDKVIEESEELEAQMNKIKS